MARALEPYQMIERSIIKKYRDELWKPFMLWRWTPFPGIKRREKCIPFWTIIPHDL